MDRQKLEPILYSVDAVWHERNFLLVCKGCGQEFAFTLADQEYFASKGWGRVPKMCKECYKAMIRERRRSQPQHKRYPQETPMAAPPALSLQAYRALPTRQHPPEFYE